MADYRGAQVSNSERISKSPHLDRAAGVVSVDYTAKAYLDGKSKKKETRTTARATSAPSLSSVSSVSVSNDRGMRRSRFKSKRKVNVVTEININSGGNAPGGIKVSSRNSSPSAQMLMKTPLSAPSFKGGSPMASLSKESRRSCAVRRREDGQVILMVPIPESVAMGSSMSGNQHLMTCVLTNSNQWRS